MNKRILTIISELEELINNYIPEVEPQNTYKNMLVELQEYIRDLLNEKADIKKTSDRYLTEITLLNERVKVIKELNKFMYLKLCGDEYDR